MTSHYNEVATDMPCEQLSMRTGEICSRCTTEIPLYTRNGEECSTSLSVELHWKYVHGMDVKDATRCHVCGEPIDAADGSNILLTKCQHIMERHQDFRLSLPKFDIPETVRQHAKFFDGDHQEELKEKSFNGRFIKISQKELECGRCVTKVKVTFTCFLCEPRDTCMHSLSSLFDHFHGPNSDEQHNKYSPFKEMDRKELSSILEITVKQDEVSKCITFLNMVLAQTDSDQFNIMFSAPSSTGKSYIPLEICQYFPADEVVRYSGASPTSFFHEKGVQVIECEPGRYSKLSELTGDLANKLEQLEDKTGKTQSDKEELKLARREMFKLISDSKMLVDLERKILIFIEQPHTMLLAKMRSFLSHDGKHLEVMITDKAGHGGNRTKHVVLRGYSSVFFCTATANIDEQEATRMVILSPETGQEKLHSSLTLISERLTDRKKFQQSVNDSVERKSLIFRIELLRARSVRKIVSPNNEILKVFMRRHLVLQPRHQRDLPRIFALTYGMALLNCFNRECVTFDTIKATTKDVEQAFALYDPVSESNEAGISPELLQIFKEIIVPAYKEKLDEGQLGINENDIARKYYEVYQKSISFYRLEKEILRQLLLTGKLSQDPDPNDRRRYLYSPLSQEALDTHSSPDESRFDLACTIFRQIESSGRGAKRQIPGRSNGDGKV